MNESQRKMLARNVVVKHNSLSRTAKDERYACWGIMSLDDLDSEMITHSVVDLGIRSDLADTIRQLEAGRFWAD